MTLTMAATHQTQLVRWNIFDYSVQIDYSLLEFHWLTGISEAGSSTMTNVIDPFFYEHDTHGIRCQTEWSVSKSKT